MAGRLQQKTVNINFPFEVGDVETIELYRYAGAPVSAEKKVVDAEETIKDLYDMFEGLTLELKEVEETTGAKITSFRFNLSDGTTYELIYGCYGVKTGNLKSSTGNFEYFTSADIGAILTLKQLPLKKASCRSKLPRFNFWTGLVLKKCILNFHHQCVGMCLLRFAACRSNID